MEPAMVDSLMALALSLIQEVPYFPLRQEPEEDLPNRFLQSVMHRWNCPERTRNGSIPPVNINEVRDLPRAYITLRNVSSNTVRDMEREDLPTSTSSSETPSSRREDSRCGASSSTSHVTTPGRTPSDPRRHVPPQTTQTLE